MAIIAKNDGGVTFSPAPAGLHHAICTAIYDLGTQYSERFDNSAHKVLIQWELPNERIEIDGESKPRAISKQYTLSLHEKATLRKDLETWRGKGFSGKELLGFDISKLLGVNCQIQIIHNTKGEKTYANISAILPLQKGMNKLSPENPLREFSIDDSEVPDGTPEWIEKIINNSEERQTVSWHTDDGQSDPFTDDDFRPTDTYDDDIPF